MVEQIPFQVGGIDTFADNPEPRCACVLLLDVSYSMAGEPIRQLQEGITHYRDELFADSLAKKRVEVAVVTFGGQVETAHDFATADQFLPPALEAKGDTPMGQATIRALDMLEERKQLYRQKGVNHFRPWLFLITDGAPTDRNTQYWTEAVQRLKESEEAKKVAFFTVGVEGADFDTLRELSRREPLKLKGLRFRDLFSWLSASQKAVSRSNPGDNVPLPPPGWAEV